MIGIRTVIDLQTCVAVVVCVIMIVGFRVVMCGSWRWNGRDLMFLLSDRVLWIVQAVSEKSSAVSTTDQDTKVRIVVAPQLRRWGAGVGWCSGIRGLEYPG